MGIRVYWDDAEQSIIRWDFEPYWDWDDFRAAVDQTQELADMVAHRVDVLPFADKSTHIPPNMLPELKRTQDRVPKNAHLIVITGATSLGNTITNMFIKIYRIHNWRTAKTLEQAYQIIAKDRRKTKSVE